MGGIPTHPVNCSHLTTADGIDKDIENYIRHGLIYEATESVYYAWLGWPYYIWYVNVYSYLDTINAIIDCGISNNVDDSMFGTTDFYENVWKGTLRAMDPMLGTLEIVWFPLMYIFITGITGGIGGLVLFIMSIVYSLDFSA